MRLEHMVPVAERLEKVGYYSVEMWGGATFDSCIRYLDEDPWERIRELKRLMPTTNMQMVIRGQSLVGYRHYPDNVVIPFVERAAENGIDIFRVFDALDDPQNMRTVIDTVRRMRKINEGTICYTISPVHTKEHLVAKAKELEDMGVDIFCLKDMAGMLAPYIAYDIVKDLKKTLGIPVHLHTHDTCGMGAMTCLMAVEAGVDIVDTVLSPFSEGTGQPPTESMVMALRGTGFDTGLDIELLADAADAAREMKKHYAQFETDRGGRGFQNHGDPDPRRRHVEHDLAVKGHRRPSSIAGDSRGDTEGARGSWVYFACDPNLSDHRGTGHRQCGFRGKIQTYHPGDQRGSKGRVWDSPRVRSTKIYSERLSKGKKPSIAGPPI